MVLACRNMERGAAAAEDIVASIKRGKGEKEPEVVVSRLDISCMADVR